MYHFLKYWAENNIFSFIIFFIDKRSYKKKMNNMQRLLASEGHIIFLNRYANFENQLTRLQNLTLCSTNRSFLYIIANFSLANAFFNILTRLSLFEKKILQKTKQAIFFASEPHIPAVPLFEVMPWKQKFIAYKTSFAKN